MALNNGKFTGEIENKNLFSYSNKLDYTIEDLDGGRTTVKGKELLENGFTVKLDKRKAKIYKYYACE